MNYVAIDIETADTANSAPCAIGLAFIENNMLTHSEEILVNPEVKFSPIASKIHGITAEVVKDACTLPDIWERLKTILEDNTIIAHNSSFDINVLRKAVERYSLSFPAIKCLDTMKAASKYLPIDNTKLSTVCEYLGLELGQAHNAKDDAEACAKVAIYFMENGNKIPSKKYDAFLNDTDAIAELTDFERSCLSEIREILNENNIASELIRFRKQKTLDIIFYYRVVRIGIVRSRYHIIVRDKYLPLVKSDLECDTVKDAHRYYLNTTNDLRQFEQYICTMASKSISEFEDYKSFVSERTVKKHLDDYIRETNRF